MPVLLFSSVVFSQVGKITIDLETDKPKKFKTKVLKSEKTGNKKFTLPRKLITNTTSHYNYYFNANNKFNEVVERARLGNSDFYYKLLSFYSYSLTNTAAQSAELDSVIYKATAGILLHDLRSSWVDNFYLLIGKAYLLKRDFDSASMTFQFINYNLYPKRKRDEDQMIVGTNTSGANSTVSIANKENTGFFRKTFLKQPSRNDALVWQIRALIEMEEYPEAAGLINTLRNDMNFPERLVPALEELNAYWFYRQGLYDSAATHLEKALPNASDMQERARSEYLLAQLFDLTKNRVKASEYYNKAIRHTTDPLLDIYANLSDAKMYDSSGLNEIDKSIATLLHMSKRDKFREYRDIIFFSAAEVALEKPDTSAAISFLTRSLGYNTNNISIKNKAFLMLADINFIRKNYKSAYMFYDSLQVGDSLLDITQLQERKNVLSKIVEKINIIEREDSLQRIALMSPADREAFIKSLSKKLRKERGVKDEDNPAALPSSVFDKSAASDIFASNNVKGDWYFYNASIKAKGYTEFRSRWGKRENVDNWRRTGQSALAPANDSGRVNRAARINAIPNAINNIQPGIDTHGDVDAPTVTDASNTQNNAGTTADISYEGLLETVPTTEEKLKASHTLLSNALFDLGKLYQSSLEDYGSAIKTYEESLERYPDSLYGGELYMNLSYCYQKLGNTAKAGYYKNLVGKKFAGSKFDKYLKNPRAPLDAAQNKEATKKYEAIYNLFIEGQFEKALEEKKAADSIYANNYWTPQLLYIESVYYIKQREDSLAIDVLNDIVTSYPNSGLKNKAQTMIDVLKRRSEIEGYLTNLTIERVKEDAPIVVDETPVRQAQPKPVVINDNPKKDTAVLSPKKEAVIDNAKKDTAVAPPKKDTVAINKKDIAVNNPKKDTAVNKPDVGKTPAPVTNKAFKFVPSTPQFVVMLLDKVDPVYVSEARNAFNRYNHEKAAGQPIEIVREVVDKEKSMLLFKQFADASSAMAYADKLKKDAATEVSWLPVNKYSFFIISEENLQLLRSNKDLPAYLKILRESVPDKF